jgi:hypothetical protein
VRHAALSCVLAAPSGACERACSDAHYELRLRRYAALIKHAAIVLVFAPAAPVLYFIGGGGILLAAAVQKWALVKLYKRALLCQERFTNAAPAAVPLRASLDSPPLS